MPATYEMVRGELTSVLNRWFDVCDRFRPVVRLLAVMLAHSGAEFVENQFLTAAQAIEGYCRIKFSCKYVPVEEFEPVSDEMRKSIPESWNSQLQDRAKNCIGSINEFNFRDRLQGCLIPTSGSHG
jgi:hypothetical protein